MDLVAQSLSFVCLQRANICRPTHKWVKYRKKSDAAWMHEFVGLSKVLEMNQSYKIIDAVV